MPSRQNAYYEKTFDGDTSPLVKQATSLAIAATRRYRLVPRTI